MSLNRLKFIAAGIVVAVFAGSAAHAAQLTSGPMAGAAAMRSAKVWMQADGAAVAQLEYWDAALAATSSPKKQLTAAIKLTEDTDFTGHFTINALEPGRKYSYRLLLDGKAISTSQPEPESLSFSTLPLWQWRTDAPDWRLAFGTCAYANEAAYDRLGKPYGGPPEAANIYASIAQKKPDMMLWGGDALYFREADYDSAYGLSYRWRHTRSAAQLQPLLRTAHHYAIWDDHEFGPNDSNSSYPFKGETLKLFKQNWANPTYGLPETPGIFTTFSYNDADFFLLDNRYYRDSDKLKADDKAKIGAAQMRWLKNAMLASTAAIKIIAAGGQITNIVNNAEGWDKFPRERDEMLKFLVDHNINGVLFLTGDRHFTSMMKTERTDSYPLYELTCSPMTAGPITNSKRDRENPQVLADTFVDQRNFCTLDFSGKKDERKITVRSFSTEGKQLWEKQLRVAELVKK